MSNEQNPSRLRHKGDYTIQLCRDYNEPLQESLLNTEYERPSEIAQYFQCSGHSLQISQSHIPFVPN